MATTVPSYEDRIKWFHQARFGMFIHWGLYAIPARGEWVMHQEHIPADEYAELAKRFRPSKFDADAWAALAKGAGMKYMVLTTRHHDGFCLFDSQASDFTSAKTAAKRDFVAEYVRACRKAGLKIGFYYSLLDWRFRGYHVGRDKDPASVEAMVKQAHAQVRELLTNYGKMVRSLQPHILINNRSGLEEDLDTPEQHVTASRPGRGWESCMTIGDSCGWGYIRHNPNMKSVTQLIQHLVTAASGEGNYLLNVGPKADGTIQDEYVERLRAIGKWMKVNGESIHGSQRCPFGGGIIGTTTAKGDTAYLHILRWPGEEACIPRVGNTVKSATVLATGKRAKVHQLPNGRLFLRGLPKAPPDKHDAVIRLRLDGPPRAVPGDWMT
jgi:alpha-L-fucosidase